MGVEDRLRVLSGTINQNSDMCNGFIITDAMRNNMSYDGRTEKFGITVAGKNYIVKLKKGVVSSIYSEYVASRFIQNLGYNSHDVFLAYYNEHQVCVLRDFTGGGYTLRTFKSIGQSSVDTELSGKSYSYEDVLHVLEMHTKLGLEDKQAAIRSFWNMFILDAILGNRDRHYNNWGFLTNGTSYKIAPIYDNGGSLFPGVATIIHSMKDNEKEFFKERSDFFPASLLLLNNKRSNYYDIIQSGEFDGLNTAIDAFTDKFTVHDIAMAIIKCKTDEIPQEFWSFYLKVVVMRYCRIICDIDVDEAYSLACDIERKYL